LAIAAPALAEPNRIENPTFDGTGGELREGASGVVPDDWRCFGVGGGQATCEMISLPMHELYTGSMATNGVRFTATTFGGDQAFDGDPARFDIEPGESYHLEFYAKTGNANGSDQLFYVGFPLFKNGNYLGREPGGQSFLSATNTWQKFTCPSFTDAEATEAHVSFRVFDDGGDDSIMIALPVVGDAPERFPLPSAEDLADIQTFGLTQKIVGTTYFYWYRWPDLHFFDDAQHTDDALTDHFVDPESVDMMSKAWHKNEMLDVIEAGIDMVWPVYWAAPGNFDNWMMSLYVKGLVPLQEALEEIESEGMTPPKIGMFYDTTSLLNWVRNASPHDGKADLTTPEGKEIFYQTIRSFFSSVHPRHWACVDGRPIVVLYSSQFAADYDQSSFDYVYDKFEQEFGGVRPYIIREKSWYVDVDSSYRWGAALSASKINGIGAVGPGYDDTEVPRWPHYFADRRNGEHYAGGWRNVLDSDVTIVHIETWNEMHEATEICESVEYGRQYIDLTRHYTALFKGFKVTDVQPARGAKLVERPLQITFAVDGILDPATVHAGTFRLTAAGGDGTFDDGNEIPIAPASITVENIDERSSRAIFDLTGVNWPEDDYEIRVVADGEDVVRDVNGRILDGDYGAELPSGDAEEGGDFVSTFLLTHIFAPMDFDEDDDIDQHDFAYLQRCLSGQEVPQTDTACIRARLDEDNDVDKNDVTLFLECVSGPNVPVNPACVPDSD
jgi:hypothetical protein